MELECPISYYPQGPILAGNTSESESEYPAREEKSEVLKSKS